MNNDFHLLGWLEKNIGFESYQHLGGRSLARIRPFFSFYLEKVNHLKIKIITVAGTNGKGQTCYSISEGLQQLNITYAQFISPHVHTLCERIQTHRGMITDAKLGKIFLMVFSRMQTEKIILSYFEFLFACFLEYALEEKVEVLVLEVGVGGRLDATNLLDCDVALITSIARDHQDLLGNRLDQILKEKIGIARPARPLITAFSSAYLKHHMNAIVGACLWVDLYDQNLVPKDADYKYTNRTLAYLALEKLFPNEVGIIGTRDEFAQKSVTLPGRGEIVVYKNYTMTLFGSHNLDGMRHWVMGQQAHKPCRPWDLIVVAFSRRPWADIKAMIQLWANLIDSCPTIYRKVLFCSFDHAKAWVPNQNEKIDLDKLLARNTQELFWKDSWRDFESFLTIKQDNHNVLIIGSYYFVSTCRQQLE